MSKITINAREIRHLGRNRQCLQGTFTMYSPHAEKAVESADVARMGGFAATYSDDVGRTSLRKVM
ncbi:hypothetical protein BAUCODRAFT_33375 [Baudoinia panamericana UAMH 10762]|uniref:Uncharacterized protein n=1 Tax=Baudoinia panamericana (strain UAMH 10762) TaxID=717646 RepID=M2NF95_BAUPA|nr:uncharacterized protein BAUCODRAFT_33375 [Baudoinia panamericana UAMH 10762]EMC97650.1 hypothetical protein BAUCODRAFT_33375 [Baudoinia panamericana UAMH 10762]